MSIANWASTGEQDCNNSIDFTDFDLALGVDGAIAAFAAEQMAESGSDADAWIAAVDAEDFEGLDPAACYAAWRGAWLATARRILAAHAESAGEHDTCEAPCGLVDCTTARERS